MTATVPERRTIGVAIPIPEPYATELQSRRTSFGDPRAVSIPTHITLIPPATVEVAELGPIEDHLRQVAAGERGFPVRLRGTGTFRPVSPVVFVRLVEGAGACERVERKVRGGPLDREPAFPYHPHVTIAHLQAGDGRGDEVLDQAVKELAGYEASFTVTGFALYEHGSDRVWRQQREFVFEAER